MHSSFFRFHSDTAQVDTGSSDFAIRSFFSNRSFFFLLLSFLSPLTFCSSLLLKSGHFVRKVVRKQEEDKDPAECGGIIHNITPEIRNRTRTQTKHRRVNRNRMREKQEETHKNRSKYEFTDQRANTPRSELIREDKFFF